MMKSTICIFAEILLGWSNREGWDGQGM